ncbi:hypothetical protein [Methanobrevibacter filiformis]|uniref:Phage-like element PBSX protein XkdG n=1 Tax=Methanobrevibacter filiformis TaxID=55758 RepID=A0A166FAD9_9EURY|nr:hypothetical protein [Methanobrevibacter filiformis]KZX17465.1 phage-like element PBSX protein XkdG precursor [Methanobrevibacter filiformis]
MDNNDILNELGNQGAAFKELTNIKDGKAILSPAHLGKFLMYASLDQTILNSAAFELMPAPEKNLNRAGIVGRVLSNGYDEEGKTRELTEDEKKGLSFGANTLIAKKLKACAKIEDDDIEDNITGEALTNTLLQEMGRAIGENLELFAVFGDTTINKADDPLLCITDGWLKLAEHQIAAEDDFTLDNASQIENIFDAGIRKLSPRFRKRDKLIFYVPFEVEDAYRDVLKSRSTGLGDATQIGFAELKYKGITIKNANTLDDPEARELIGAGKVLLTQPENLAWGIRSNLSIEPERKAGMERTDYWFRIRGDADHYFRDGAVVTTIPNDILDSLNGIDTEDTGDGGEQSPIG